MKGKVIKITTLLSIVMFLIMSVAITHPYVVSAAVDPTDVVKIGEEGYATLEEALEVANASDTATTITLLGDVEVNEILTISKNVIIEGKYTIIRAQDDPTTTDVNEAYKGTIFLVSPEAKLTLDGDITIDGGNNWIFKETEFFEAVEAFKVEIPTQMSIYTFIEYDKQVVANAHLIVVDGILDINRATITNNFGTNGRTSGPILVRAKGTLNINAGALLTHNIATGYGGSVVTVNDGSFVNINEGSIITKNLTAQNGGCIYNNGGTITMNAGKIIDNYGFNNNGVAIMLHQNSATLIMNDGEICSNIGITHLGGGHCGTVYLHSSSIMEMYGGSICHNVGVSVGGIHFNNPKSLTIYGGSIVNNSALLVAHENYASRFENFQDIQDNASTKITGGTFTQDVTKYCEEEYYYLPLSDSEEGVVTKCINHEFVDSVCTVCTYKCPHTTTEAGDKPATCAEKAYCSTCENVYGDLLEHNYTCVANDEENTFQVTCDQGCEYDETVTLESPTNLVYNGNPIPAILSGEIVNMPVIEYDTADGQAPVEAGTYTATIRYEDKSVSIEYTILPATPILTITSPTPAIIPGTSMVLKVEIKNPENEGLEDLPTNFVIKYRVGTSDEVKEITGLRLTIEDDIALGQSIYVYVENEEVAGKYGVGQSNVLTLYVGQIDYSGDIDAVAKALEQAKEELSNALDLGDEELNTKVEELQNALINVNNILTTIPDEYATKKELAEAKTELEAKIEEAKTEVLDKTNKALEDAKAELEAAIDTKANATDVETAINDLKAAVKLAEQTAKDFATSQDEALKALLLQAIEEAKEAAIDTASKELAEVKAELETLIDTKADKVTLEEKVKELTETIEITKQVVKEFAVEEDAKLKLYFDQEIERANQLIQEVADRVTANEIAIENINAAIEALKKVDEEQAAALAKAVEMLGRTIEQVAESAAAMDEALEEKLIEAREILTGRVEKIEKNLNNTKKALEEAIKSGDENLEEKINELNKALEAAKIALEAKDENNKAELEAKIEEGTKALEAAIKEVQNRLDNVKTELDKMDEELQAKDNELQRTITIICIVLCVLICLYAAFMVWYIIDRKRIRK